MLSLLYAPSPPIVMLLEQRQWEPEPVMTTWLLRAVALVPITAMPVLVRPALLVSVSRVKEPLVPMMRLPATLVAVESITLVCPSATSCPLAGKGRSRPANPITIGRLTTSDDTL